MKWIQKNKDNNDAKNLKKLRKLNASTNKSMKKIKKRSRSFKIKKRDWKRKLYLFNFHNLKKSLRKQVLKYKNKKNLQ